MKPWEKYQSTAVSPPSEEAPAGPWAKYRPPHETSAMPQRGHGDLLDTAWQDVKDLGSGIWNVAKKVASVPTVDAYKTGQEIAQGVPLKDTTTGQNVRGATEIVKSLPGAMWNRAKEIATDPVGSFQEHPVNTVLDVASVAFPATKVAGAGKLAARAGTAAAEGAANAVRAGGLELGQRTLGFSKRFLKTPQAQSEAKAATELAVKKGIIKSGDDGVKMLDKVTSMMSDAGKRMDDFLVEQNAGMTRAKGPRAAPDLREQFLFDPKQAAAELEQLRPRFKGGDWDRIHERIDRAMQTIQGAGNRPIPWTQAQEIKELFQSLADWKSNREATVLDRKIAGIFRKSMDDQLEEVAAARGNAPGFEAFKQAKREFQLGSRMKDALLNRISSDVGNNTISLTDLVLAAPNIATGNIPGVVAMGVGKKVAQRYGGSAVTEGAMNLAEKLKTVPQAFGRYAAPLTQAAERGSQSLAVTDFVLQQRDPAYRKILEALEQGGRSPAFQH